MVAKLEEKEDGGVGGGGGRGVTIILALNREREKERIVTIISFPENTGEAQR